jgi:hypothetical protein
MSKARIAILVVIGLVAILAVGALVLRGQLDGLVARAIETHGSRLTGTEVTVGSVKLELRQGRATITDLKVHNPDGFSDRTALGLGTLVLDIDPGSLREEPYRIDELTVRDVEGLYEVNADGRRNLDVIRDHLEASRPTAEATGDDGEPVPAPRLIIGRLELPAGRLEADASALGVDARQLEFPGFVLEDLGGQDGAPANAIGKEVLTRLAKEAAQAALASELQGQLEELLEDKVGDDVKDKVEDALEGVLGGK